MNPADQHRILPASPGQSGQIAALARETFLQTYAGTTIEAHLTAYVDEHFTEDVMRSELETPGFQY
ncbi:MAG: hypothetical protein ACK5VH_01440, partial [bacterium]